MSQHRRLTPLALLYWSIVLAIAGTSSAEDRQIVTVEGVGKELGLTPIVVEYKGPAKTTHSYVLQSLDDPGKQIPADLFADQGKTYLGFLLDRLPASGSRKFELRVGSPGTAGPIVQLLPTGPRISVLIDGKPLTTYIPDDGPKPYFFPLLGPGGEPMTRSFPMAKVVGEKTDHPHHRSLWFTHGSVNKVDFWSEVPGHGTIKETSRPTVVGGSAVGVLRTTDDWIAFGGKKVCEDERVVRFYNSPGQRIIDFEITLKANAGAVTFGDTKEGMFGLRVPTTMDVTSNGGGKILNAEGVVDKAAWGKASPWVDYSGPVGGKTVGIAILNHPESFRSPTTWHVRDYGLFAANPFGWKDFGRKTSGDYTLPAGESIQFRYRIILHEGDAVALNLPDAFRAYEASPKVTIE